MIESLFGGSTQIINILGGVGFFAVVLITAWVMFVYMRQIRSAKAEGELAEENWDGIGEFKNPLPVGWTIILIGAMIWAAWYWLFGYPVNAYSQIGEWNQETKEYKAQFENTWQNTDQSTLVAMGESIYLAKCAPCHGNTADGMDGRAANLVEYGNAAHIAHVVEMGSKGLGYPMGEMPAKEGIFNMATGAPVTAAEIKTVSAYVANGMKGEGEEIFANACASCHGADGMGMGGMAPDLTAYGSVDFAVKAIKHGKMGHIGNMPAFEKEGTLTDLQYQAVASYILSL